MFILFNTCCFSFFILFYYLLLIVCFLISFCILSMLILVFVCLFFFFKQKTAYDMRISDWSSDVCSSDLVGCGDGALLAWLAAQKNVDGRGIEISREGVRACVSQGLSVIQGDANTDLNDYPSDAFDYVVLSKTLQATRNPREVLQDLVRIGRRAAVSFVNYGHWRTRLGLLLSGRAPVTTGNGRRWFDSEDIHPCTLIDFVELCRDLGLVIE